MEKKINCWEFMNCGREPMGYKVKELGVCPASIDNSADALNGGVNGGRICWAIAGSFCEDYAQGTFANEKACCFLCDFYRLVFNEEGFREFKVLKPAQLIYHSP